MNNNFKDYIISIFQNLRRFIIAAFFCLILPIIFSASFSKGLPLLAIKNSSAQALLDCSDPTITPNNKIAGDKCLMSYCSDLKAPIAPQSSGPNPNCVDFICSDPGLKNIRPGINCAMKSCLELPAGHVANPNINCTMADCAKIAGTPILTNSNGLQANCSYMGLPLCSVIDKKSRKPRINCADLVDLQLNTDVRTLLGHNVELKKDSVIECKNIDNPNPNALPPLVAGVNYAVHNRDCIRFCDQIEDLAKRKPGVNCSIRKCYQLNSSDLPSSNKDCILQKCNLLTADELENPKFNRKNEKYCDSDNVKCYQFSEEQLRFVKPAQMCQLHYCQLPPNSPASCGVDDIFHIFDKGKSYQDNYIAYITGHLPISSNCDARSIVCRQISITYYQCLPKNDSTQYTKPNPNCDQDGQGNKCNDNGMCYKTIDCNLASNANLAQCAIGKQSSYSSSDDEKNKIDAWFYRPIPLKEQYDTIKLARIDSKETKLCYMQEDVTKIHIQEMTEASISPGLCKEMLSFGNSIWNSGGDFVNGINHVFSAADFSHFNSRGAGYINLCGTNNQFYQAADPLKTAYIGTTAKTENDKHHVDVCIRFKNIYAANEEYNLQACGARQCLLHGTDAFGYYYQYCGHDYCDELVVNDANGKECEMNDRLFANSPDKKCLKVIDDNIRIRAVRYGNRICTFMDVRGHLAYNTLPTNPIHFFNGSETLQDGTCISGIKDQNGVCRGFNTNKNPDTDKWYRTVFLIPYIADSLNPDSSDNSLPHGYYDLLGKFFKSQQCATIKLKIAPPKAHNLANTSNSPNFFYPSPFISAIKDKKGGRLSNDKHTDFFYPEIEVSFGTTKQLMSLEAGCTGYEKDDDKDYCDTDPIAPSKIYDLSTTVSQKDYQASVFVRKEFDPTTLEPLFCLYQKTKINNAVEDTPIECVSRNYPEINNYKSRSVNQSIATNRIIIRSDDSSKYNDLKIGVRYLIDSGNDKIDNSCSKNRDNNCSGKSKLDEIKFENISADYPSCNNIRSKQNSACPQINDCNSINLKCAIADKNPAQCFEGETCLFGDILKKIIFYQLPDNTTGRCLNNRDSWDKNARSNPVESYPLCVKRDECSKLNVECVDNQFNLYQAKNSANPDIEEINKYLAIQKNCDDTLLPSCNVKKGISFNAANGDLAYGWFNEVCIVSGFQTKYRKIIAHELPNHVTGKCLIDKNSHYLTDNDPATNCNDGGEAPNCNCIEYNEDRPLETNQIARYETPHEAGLCIKIPLPEICRAITYNPEPNIANNNDLDYSYQSINKSSYNPPHIHDANGVDISHKYRSFGSQELNIPIAGHADFGATLVNMDAIGTCSGYFKKSIIKGREVDPILRCLKMGQEIKWNDEVINPCIRYSCDGIKALNPDSNGIYPGNYSISENGDDRGLANGFANWPKYTKTNDFLESVDATSCITGFKPSNGRLPSRFCNQLGSYLPVVNQCVRITCEAINPEIPTSDSDLALWQKWNESGGARFPQTKASRSGAEILPESIATGSCNNDLGYFQIGKPPTRGCDHLGNWQQKVENTCETGCVAINDEIGGNYNDGYALWPEAEIQDPETSVNVRAKSCATGYVVNPYSKRLPTRKCRHHTTNKGISFDAWDPVEDACIKQCPGSDIDLIHGVTTHNSSNGQIKINWKSTNLNETAYVSDQLDLNASNFQPGRSDHHYLLSRKCNANGEWLEPEVMCSAAEGMIGNAWYKSLSQTSLSNSIAVGATLKANRCIQDYAPNNDLPIRECKYADNNNNIDQVYLSLTSNDCEQSKCRINNHQYFGNSEYISQANTDYYLQGSKAVLRCKGGYGHHENRSGVYRTITNNPEIDICQSEYHNWFGNTNRVADAPTITCGANGNWIELENDCTICNSCNNQSLLAGQTNIHLLDNCLIHQQFCLYNATNGTFYNINGSRRCDSNSGAPLAIDNFNLRHLGAKSQNASFHNQCYKNNNIYSWNYWFGNNKTNSYVSAGIKLTCYDGRIYSRMIYSNRDQGAKDPICIAEKINFDGPEQNLSRCKISR
jgi:hypothetical protein